MWKHELSEVHFYQEKKREHLLQSNQKHVSGTKDLKNNIDS